MTVEFNGKTNACTSITMSRKMVMGQTNQRARTPETYDKLHSQVTIINMPIAIRARIAACAPATVVAVATAASAPLSAARTPQSTAKIAKRVSRRDDHQRIR